MTLLKANKGLERDIGCFIIQIYTVSFILCNSWRGFLFEEINSFTPFQVVPRGKIFLNMSNAAKCAEVFFTGLMPVPTLDPLISISVYHRLLYAPAPKTGSCLYTERSSISNIPVSFYLRVFMRAIGLCVFVKCIRSGLSKMFLSSIGASCFATKSSICRDVYSSWSSSLVFTRPLVI